MKVKQGSLWCHGTTKPHVVRLCDRTARVFELFSLDIPGFSGFLLLSYPVCGP